MPVHRTVAGTVIGHDTGRLPPHSLGWIGATAMLGAATIALAVLLPAPLVLPALSILLVTIGFTVAAGLYLAGYRMERDHSRGWEFAAVLVFLGFAAAMLTDSREALTVLDQMRAGGATASSK